MDPTSVDPNVKVGIEFSRRGGRADFIVPLKAERRYGGYRAASHRVIRSEPGIEVHEVVPEETGEPRSFVGPYGEDDQSTAPHS